MLSLPDNLPNLIIANNSVTGNVSSGATNDKPNTSTSITVENVADDRSAYKWAMTISIKGKTITAKYDGGSGNEHCYFDLSQITLLKQ